MQHDILPMTNFLIDQKSLDIRSLISRQLNDFSRFFIFLYGTIAREILFEGFANAFHIQIIGESGHGCDTFASIALLDPDVDFFFRGDTALVAGVFKGVCELLLLFLID